jgi:hypothetical protein
LIYTGGLSRRDGLIINSKKVSRSKKIQSKNLKEYKRDTLRRSTSIRGCTQK